MHGRWASNEVAASVPADGEGNPELNRPLGPRSQWPSQAAANRRLRRLGRRALACGLLALSAAACGPGSGQSRTTTPAADPVRWVDGETFSSPYALQVVEVPGRGAVVVDAAAATKGGRRVRARWLRGSERSVATDRDRPALIFPSAWAGRGRLYVAGYSCATPNLDDIDLLDSNLVQGCGDGPVAYVIRILDLAQGSWTEVDPALPGASGRPVDVLAVGPAKSTFAPVDGGDGSRRAAYEIDLATGGRQEILGGAVSTCPSGGTQLALRPTKSEDSGTAPTARFALVADGRVRDLGVAIRTGVVKLGCSDDAMVLWLPGERATLIAQYVEGTVRQDRIDLPGGRSVVRPVAQHNLGSSVAVWEDQGESFALWQFTEGRWARCGPQAEGLDPPDVVAVIDCVAVTASSRTHALSTMR